MCNKCHTENRDVDRVCCRHLDIHHVDRETECVTNSEEFKEICLYRPYLEVILVGLSRIRDDHLENNTSNRSFRFAAYTAITCWVYGKLGRHSRRVVWAIRRVFPEASGVYANFKPRNSFLIVCIYAKIVTFMGRHIKTCTSFTFISAVH